MRSVFGVEWSWAWCLTVCSRKLEEKRGSDSFLVDSVNEAPKAHDNRRHRETKKCRYEMALLTHLRSPCSRTASAQRKDRTSFVMNLCFALHSALSASSNHLHSLLHGASKPWHMYSESSSYVIECPHSSQPCNHACRSICGTYTAVSRVHIGIEGGVGGFMRRSGRRCRTVKLHVSSFHLR